MAEPNGNGSTLKWLIQLLMPAVLAVGGSYAAVASKLAVLEERIAGVRHEMALANDQNVREHVRLEQKDADLAAAVAERRRK